MRVVGPVSKVGDDGLGSRGSDVDLLEHATIENAGFDSGFRDFTCPFHETQKQSLVENSSV